MCQVLCYIRWGKNLTIYITNLAYFTVSQLMPYLVSYGNLPEIRGHA